MHVDSADLIGAVICAIAIIRLWRLVLMLLLIAATCAIILGVATTIAYLHH
jgi:hypothetical protein